MTEVMVDGGSGVNGINPALSAISGKRVLLSSSAIKSNFLYYSELDSAASYVEAEVNNGRYITALNVLTFGGTSQVTIPNASFVSQVWLRLVLPPLLANQTLPLGWGYLALGSNALQYTMGSSNVASISVSANANFLALYHQCEHPDSKLSELMLLGGACEIGATTYSPEATILLNLPFSTGCGGGMLKKPVDSAMLSNPIQLQITLANYNSIYGGLVQPTNTGFSSGQIIVTQVALTDTQMSLSGELRKDPTKLYSYPFIYYNTFAGASFTGSTNISSPVSVPLLAIINSDLVAVILGLVKVSDLSANYTTGTTPSGFNFQTMSNAAILFNGQYMQNTPGYMYRLINQRNLSGSGYYNNAVTNMFLPGVYTVTPVKNYPLVWDASFMRASCETNHLSNVQRFGNQSLVATFNTPDTSQYQLVVIYCYNGIIEFQQQQSSIFFD
jgi:hypothetical protein